MTKFKTLYTPIQIKQLELKNRVVMPPMCQYRAIDGLANNWHFVHYVSRAVGGVGLIIVEMTNVLPNGRITPNCLGLWNDAQRDALKKIVDEVHAQGARIAIQIAHAGRKALGTEKVVAPSALLADEPLSPDKAQWAYQHPHALTQAEITEIIQAFQDAVKRAVAAGFDAIEIHAAHGYLIHQFYSPKMNSRNDQYGKDKMRFGEEVIQAAKAVMPKQMPLLVRLSAKEYGENGFDIDYGCAVAKRFAEAGADILHVSGGGDGRLSPRNAPKMSAGYQVPLAHAVKTATGKPVIAVGLLDNPMIADEVLSSGYADLVAIGRGLLRDPYWLLNTQYNPNATDNTPIQFVPEPYMRAY